MQKIGIVFNPQKESAQQLMMELRDWLQKREVEVFDNSEHSVDVILSEVSLVICLGGDGTILSVAGKMVTKSVPILAVNLGSLGFLTEVKKEEVYEELNAYFINQSQIEERLTLSCSVRSEKTKQERRFLALNDIVISREGLSRILNVEVQIGRERLTRFPGDGVIIATPTGSTAYSLSAGSSVVHPKLEAILVTPICPHTSALRSIVVSADEKISVKICPKHDTAQAVLSADGQENIEIDDSYSIEVTRSSMPLKLVKSSKRSYWTTLKEKFKFPE